MPGYQTTPRGMDNSLLMATCSMPLKVCSRKQLTPSLRSFPPRKYSWNIFRVPFFRKIFTDELRKSVKIDMIRMHNIWDDACGVLSRGTNYSPLINIDLLHHLHSSLHSANLLSKSTLVWFFTPWESQGILNYKLENYSSLWRQNLGGKERAVESSAWSHSSGKNY